MNRISTIFALMIAAPTLMAAGGQAPPTGEEQIARNPRFEATLVLDPHMAMGDPRKPSECGFLTHNVTTTAKQASLQIKDRGVVVSHVDFKVLPNFQLYFGCDPDETDNRFLGKPLSEWVPPAALRALFNPLGEVLSETRVPVVTAFEESATSNICVFDSANPGPLVDGGRAESCTTLGDGTIIHDTAVPVLPGIFILNMEIGFCTGC